MPAGELASCRRWLFGGRDGRVQEVESRRLTDTALSCAPPVKGNDTSGGRPANRAPVRPPAGWKTPAHRAAAARQLQRLVGRPSAWSTDTTRVITNPCSGLTTSSTRWIG